MTESDDIVNQLAYFAVNEVRMPAGFVRDVIEEIERLRAALALAQHAPGSATAGEADRRRDEDPGAEDPGAEDAGAEDVVTRRGDPPIADDLVARLRARHHEVEEWWPRDEVPLTLVGEAAEEIARLRYEMERLAVALDDISHLSADRQVLHRIAVARRG